MAQSNHLSKKCMSHDATISHNFLLFILFIIILIFSFLFNKKIHFLIFISISFLMKGQSHHFKTNFIAILIIAEAFLLYILIAPFTLIWSKLPFFSFIIFFTFSHCSLIHTHTHSLSL